MRFPMSDMFVSDIFEQAGPGKPVEIRSGVRQSNPDQNWTVSRRVLEVCDVPAAVADLIWPAQSGLQNSALRDDGETTSFNFDEAVASFSLIRHIETGIACFQGRTLRQFVGQKRAESVLNLQSKVLISGQMTAQQRIHPPEFQCCNSINEYETRD